MLSLVASPVYQGGHHTRTAILATALRQALICHVPAGPDPKSDKHSSDTGSSFLGRQAGSPEVTQAHLPKPDAASKSGTAGPEGAS